MGILIERMHVDLLVPNSSFARAGERCFNQFATDAGAPLFRIDHHRVDFRIATLVDTGSSRRVFDLQMDKPGDLSVAVCDDQQFIRTG